MVDEDRISSLPKDITHLILTHMPLKEVVRTSILSKGWRYTWTTFPNLVFDKNCCPASCTDKTSIGEKLVSTINSVLSRHTGPIHVLDVSDVYFTPDIDRWILRASSRSVKKLRLLTFGKITTELPSSLYACDNLNHLELINCILKPPAAFKGFEKLKTLDLCLVSLTDEDFERMISGCPLLEKLTVRGSVELKHPIINAPKLKYFTISCDLHHITFGDATVNLLTIYVSIKVKKDTKHQGEESYLTAFFRKLLVIERLVVQIGFLEYLGIGPILEKLPTPCICLRHLSVRIALCEMKESLAALCIFRSSPNLTELEIQSDYTSRFNVTSDWLNENTCGCWFDKLRVVKVGYLYGTKGELEFIGFVLKNSPGLEKMHLACAHEHDLELFVQETSRFKKASTHVEFFITLETM